MISRFPYCLSLLLIWQISACQVGLPDSLKIPSGQKEDTVKVFFLNEAGKFFCEQEEPDSAFSYLRKATELAKKLQHLNGEAVSYLQISNVYLLTDRINEAVDYLFKALEVRKQQGQKKACAIIYKSVGNIYITNGNYPEALKNFFIYLKMGEELSDETIIARGLGSIGVIYMKQKEYDKSIDYCLRAIEIQKRLGKKLDLSKTYNFIGNAYDEKHMMDSALVYHNRSLKLKEEMNDEEGIASSYHNIANILTDLRRYKEAEETFMKAIKIYSKYNNPDLPRTYGAMSKLYVMMNRLDDALRCCLEALAYEKDSNLDNAAIIHQNLSHVYAMKGSFEKALFHYKKWVQLNDSILNEENLKESIRLEMNYDFDKKTAQAKLEQEKKDAVALAESKRQKYIILSVCIILLIVLSFALYAFRSYIQKKRANKEILSQKQIIEEKQKEILDSIHYAKRIQSSLMSSEAYIDKNLKKLQS